MAEARFKCPESDAARLQGGGGTARHVGCGGERAGGSGRAAAPPEAATAARARRGPPTAVPRADGEVGPRDLEGLVGLVPVRVLENGVR